MTQQRNKYLDADKKTVEKMIKLYCKNKHGSDNSLCEDCQSLLEYAQKRLELCRYGINKPTCGKCPIHCYKPEMRQKIKKVMAYAGPRMIIYHPIEALKHLTQSFRPLQ